MIVNFVHEILNSCMHQSLDVSQVSVLLNSIERSLKEQMQTALEALSTLAVLSPQLDKLEPILMPSIINQLSSNIIAIITKSKIVTTNQSVAGI